MQEEIWKDIPDYDGYYQVSTLGRIRSVDRVVPHSILGTQPVKGRILMPSYNDEGYLRVILCKNNKKKYVTVHRLVAITYIENPFNKETVNHKNSKRDDNRVVNLEWNTVKENARHGWEFGFHKPVLSGCFGKDHPTSVSVVKLDLDYNFICEYGSQLEAQRETGIFSSNINVVCHNGKQKTAGGYRWMFATDYYK